MRNQILYLDAHRAGAVVRALRKHGEVAAAEDINQALYLIAETDFDYYFVCADTPQAQAFLKHLRHDPQLSPPSGVVLITDNLEEDCAAWSVNTFITRSRIKEDIPYIFSHMRREPPAPANVLSIAPTGVADRHQHGGKLQGENPGRTFYDSPEARPAEEEIAPPGETITRPSGEPVVSHDSPGKHGTVLRGRYKAGVVLMLLAAVVAWLFTWGPLAARRAQPGRSSHRRVEAESAIDESKHVSPFGDEPYTYLATEVRADHSSPAASSQLAAPVPDAAAPPYQSTTPLDDSNTAENRAVPSSSPNRPPSASISGPSQVMARQSATYSASGSDPDGDSISFSWGSSTVTRCWSTPGLYSVDVTVTDGRGATATASMSVRVI